MARALQPHHPFVERPTPLLCRIWGHRIDPDASYSYCVDHCERCLKQVLDTGPREWLKTQAWIVRRRIRDAVKPLINFFRRCPDCQHRFNRCDPGIDHLPF